MNDIVCYKNDTIMEVVGLDRSHLQRHVQLKKLYSDASSSVTVPNNKKRKNETMKENRKTVKKINAAAKDMLVELNEIEKKPDDSLSMNDSD